MLCSALHAITTLHSRSWPLLIPFLSPLLYFLQPPRVVLQHLGLLTAQSQDANAMGAHNVCIKCASSVVSPLLVCQLGVAVVYGPIVLTSSSPGSGAVPMVPTERCDVSLTEETTNTKTHTQVERGSMTKRCDPHKISVKDTNKSWLWLWVCNLFEFQRCKGLVLPPRGSFIVVRSYSQPILRLGGLRSVPPKMYNFYARFIEYKCVDPVVLLDFEDIRIFCNF